MSVVQLDERGVLMECTNCGQRNRLTYERLEQVFRCGKCQQQLRPPSEPIDVCSDDEFFALTTRSILPILVDFWAPWCGPCKMVAPEVTKVAAAVQGRVLVVKVNTEQLQSLAQRFSISGIPTFILFSGGVEVARQSGALPAQQIQKFIEQSLSVPR